MRREFFCALLEMAPALMKNAELDYGQNAVFLRSARKKAALDYGQTELLGL